MAPTISVALIWPLPGATLTPAGKTLVKGKDFAAIRILLFPRCLSGPVGAAGEVGGAGTRESVSGHQTQ